MSTLRELNAMSREAFIDVCGGLFEHSPWVADRTWERRPFESRDALHAQMMETVLSASAEEKLALIRAHPDLVGRLAAEGKLTRESTGEQMAAGLVGLNAEEAALFERYNAAYRERFGFPFVICARENRKDAILAAFPIRLQHSREAEIETAMTEIGKIARFRLIDRVLE
jgi:OHCU decarboxylase